MWLHPEPNVVIQKCDSRTQSICVQAITKKGLRVNRYAVVPMDDGRQWILGILFTLYWRWNVLVLVLVKENRKQPSRESTVIHEALKWIHVTSTSCKRTVQEENVSNLRSQELPKLSKTKTQSTKPYQMDTAEEIFRTWKKTINSPAKWTGQTSLE